MDALPGRNSRTGWGIGLLTPWLAGLAAAGLAADMAGATIINATVLHNTAYGGMVWVTLPLCAAFALLAYGRRQQIKGLWAAIRRYGRPTGPGYRQPSAHPRPDGAGVRRAPRGSRRAHALGAIATGPDASAVSPPTAAGH